MLARGYERLDALTLQRQFGFGRSSDVFPGGLDELVLVGNAGAPTGVLVYRPGAFVHELHCGTDLWARARADAMVNYAMAQAKAKPHPVRCGIFLVKPDNQAMLRYLESIGAVEQSDPGDRLFTVKL